VLQVDDRPEAMALQRRSDVCVLGDARRVAEAMLDGYLAADLAPQQRNVDLRSRIAAFDPLAEFTDASTEDTVDPRTAMARLNRLLPRNRIVVTDTGRFLYAAWRYFDVTDPRCSLHTQAFASIGLGLATAVGASAARSDLVTVVVMGDGGGMMGFTEFIVAVRRKLPLIAVVVNDGCYGLEYGKLRAAGVDPAHAALDLPSFAAIARAMGGNGVTITSVAELDALTPSTWRRENLPLVIEVSTDPAVSPE
jgi:acetolactate synthase I/II/III large subunit